MFKRSSVLSVRIAVTKNLRLGGGKMGGLSLERARYELGKHGCTELKAKPGKK